MGERRGTGFTIHIASDIIKSKYNDNFESSLGIFTKFEYFIQKLCIVILKILKKNGTVFLWLLPIKFNLEQNYFLT